MRTYIQKERGGEREKRTERETERQRQRDREQDVHALKHTSMPYGRY